MQEWDEILTNTREEGGDINPISMLNKVNSKKNLHLMAILTSCVGPSTIDTHLLPFRCNWLVLQKANGMINLELCWLLFSIIEIDTKYSSDEV